MDRREDFNGGYQQRDLNLVRYLVVHHSGIDTDSTAEDIDIYHKNLGWPGLAYNWLIHWDGTVEYVGDISTLRYNVAGRNHEVVGVCIPGDWTYEEPPQPALDALDWLITNLKTDLPDLIITTHRRIALPGHGTSCPGDALDEYVAGRYWRY